MISLLLRSVARIILPPALLFAAYLLFRGHNSPGGGFVAGLMTGGVAILQYVATDRKTIARLAPVAPQKLIALGLTLAVLTGAGSLVLGYPFLTSTLGHIDLPVLGRLETSTALFFDLGVYCVVTGITLTILLAIEE